jgi:hypothetical protein
MKMTIPKPLRCAHKSVRCSGFWRRNPSRQHHGHRNAKPRQGRNKPKIYREPATIEITRNRHALGKGLRPARRAIEAPPGRKPVLAPDLVAGEGQLQRRGGEAHRIGRSSRFRLRVADGRVLAPEHTSGETTGRERGPAAA